MTFPVFSPESIQLHKGIYNREAACSTVFALACVFLILKYSPKTMSKSYRFHLLNITIFTLFCDLNITVLTQFYQLWPANGACYIGELGVLTKWMNAGAVMKVMIFVFTFILMSNISTMCNAAIHRYLFVSSFAGEKRYNIPGRYVHAFMIFLQFVFPLIASALLLNVDFRPDAVVEQNKELFPEIFNKSADQPCVFLVSGVAKFVEYYFLYGFCFGLHIVFCAFVTKILLVLCWYKILHIKQNAVSKRTLKMERRLLFALTIQSLFPCIVFLLAIFNFWLNSFFDFFNFLSPWINKLFPVHSTANFGIVCVTIPVYRNGVLKDLQSLFSCFRHSKKQEAPAISNLSAESTTEQVFPLKMRVSKLCCK